MRRLLSWAVLLISPVASAAEPASPPIRGLLTEAGGISPEFLDRYRNLGLNSVVIALNETDLPAWSKAAKTVKASGYRAYAWIEVGRNPRMADDHPEWMASIGGHHDDWRTRFPDAPKHGPELVVKAYPWVPIGYSAAFAAHRERVRGLLRGIDAEWSGVFLNDLQTAPSSCGCGNDQCRWALDYGVEPTAKSDAGNDSAARFVADVKSTFPGKSVIPVWVTECETVDLATNPESTGHCGTVPCATGACWPRYSATWNRLLEECDGPLAVGAWSDAFRRDLESWPAQALSLFRKAPRGAKPIEEERAIVVLSPRTASPKSLGEMTARVANLADGWIYATSPVDQSWTPKGVRRPK